jgi:uracil-DNA glycosylase family 4
MGDSPDDLRDLVRDAQGHAVWLRDSGETEVLKTAEPVKLVRPLRSLDMSEPAKKVHVIDPLRVSTPMSVVAAGHPETPIGNSSDPAVRLIEIREALGDCQRCRLCSGRKKIVYGVGSPQAQLMFVGEGPGADEDRSGEPFVGAAGQLLTKMIAAMGLTRQQVYIANCVKCRPPENRTPQSDELATCMPFLHAQIEAIQPKVIVALGKTAAQALIGEHVAITKIRGQWRPFRKGPIKMMPTYHPSFLLRVPSEKRAAWADLQLVMKELGLPAKGA